MIGKPRPDGMRGATSRDPSSIAWGSAGQASWDYPYCSASSFRYFSSCGRSNSGPWFERHQETNTAYSDYSDRCSGSAVDLGSKVVARVVASEPESEAESGSVPTS